MLFLFAAIPSYVMRPGNKLIVINIVTKDIEWLYPIRLPRGDPTLDDMPPADR